MGARAESDGRDLTGQEMGPTVVAVCWRGKRASSIP